MRLKTARRLLCGFLLLLFVMLSAPQVKAADVVELSFVHAFNHVSPEVQQQIVDEFNRLHPNIRVVIEPIHSTAARETLITRAAGGVSPDIISTVLQ